MSRRGGRRRQRDTIDISSPTPTFNSLLLSSFHEPPARLLSPVSVEDFSMPDRREFHPDAPFNDALYVSGVPATVSEVSPSFNVSIGRSERAPVRKGTMRAMYYPQFNNVNKVAICIRRKQRREVLFAKKRFGRGGARRRNYFSNVRC